MTNEIIIKNNKKSSLYIIYIIKRWALFLSLTIITILVMINNNAWSYNNNSVNNISMTSFKNVSRETLVDTSFNSNPSFQSTLPPPVINICKSLLNSDNHTPLNIVTGKNQRTAGKVAAVGILLGARFALEPKKQNTKKANILQKIHADNNINKKKSFNKARSARSIAAFRKCQKEYILSKI